MRKKKVLGWGYEGRSVSDLIDFAKTNGAKVVIDVRLNPMSRRSGFSKRALSDQLASAGIRYQHQKALGNPTDNRSAFAHPGSESAIQAHARFDVEILKTGSGQSALEEINGLLQVEPVVILCFEEEEAKCHRSLVIAELLGNRFC